MKEFVHLHVHSQYSVLDGLGKIEEYVKHAKELGHPALAITDHGNLSGMVEHYKYCKEYGIKPIIGMESYIVPDIYDKISTRGEERDYGHILLLAKNNEGLHNLIQLSTEAYLNGFYYKPRIDFNMLQKYHKGIICMTACSGGEIAKIILRGNNPEDALLKYQGLFKEDFYLELMYHGYEEEKIMNLKLIECGNKLGIKCVPTNDVHYLKKEDKRFHETLLAIQMKRELSDPKLRQMGDYHFAPRTEMAKIFRKDFLENTLEVAEKCNVEIELNKVSLPKIELKNTSLKDFFYNICMAQLGIYGLDKIKQYVDRLNYEIEAIDRGGFLSYFYIVRDYVQWAKKNGIMVGPGRGSGAGSLVVYLLGITMVDPIKYDLKFERFINPDRKTLPDLDIDFEIDRREEVVNYIKGKYGENRVSQIITFGKMDEKGAVKSVAKVCGVSYKEINDVTSDPSFELSTIKHKYPIVYEAAEKLIGVIKHVGTHAAGICICDTDLTNRVALMKNQDKICTQLEMHSLKDIGLPKFDCLGLKNLSVIKETLELIKARKGKEIVLKDLTFDDIDVYKMLRQGHAMGVFQLESPGMRELLKNIKIDKFDDLVAVLALYRPGPLGSGLHNKYAEGKFRSKISYPHPKLEGILKTTNGVIVYQEQVMEIASVLAGLTGAQADDFRRGVGEKDFNLIHRQKKVFIEGCVKNGVEEDLATRIFDSLLKFAGYAFNKSHATAYAFISYYTAWLKYRHTLEYMTCLLNYEMSSDSGQEKYMKECKRLNIEVLPVNVNVSKPDFTIEGSNIRTGLNAVKGIGRNAAVMIAKCAPFVSVDDFSIRTKGPVDKSAVAILEGVNAFKGLVVSRQAKLF